MDAPDTERVEQRGEVGGKQRGAVGARRLVRQRRSRARPSAAGCGGAPAPAATPSQKCRSSPSPCVSTSGVPLPSSLVVEVDTPASMRMEPPPIGQPAARRNHGCIVGRLHHREPGARECRPVGPAAPAGTRAGCGAFWSARSREQLSLRSRAVPPAQPALRGSRAARMNPRGTRAFCWPVVREHGGTTADAHLGDHSRAR